MTVFFPKNGIEMEAGEGETLLDAIRAAGLPIEALCSGRGACGKCLVRVDGERRLACRTLAADGQRVEILASAEGQDILTDSGAASCESRPAGARPAGSEAAGRAFGAGAAASGRAAFAIDVGTTTVAVKAVDTGSGRELAVRAFTNPQRVYGADVLSRINNAMDDASALSGLITDALGAAIKEIACDGAVCPKAVDKVVIAGNTTMSYLLLGLRCRSLGLAPFEPEYALKPSYSYREVFKTDGLDCPVYIYPYISAFVGGDIVSGLVNIGRHLETGQAPSFMLVDMGTNGEIAYRCGDRLITTSTAAGPALEGGNIACGMSGMDGAVHGVRYEAANGCGGRFSVKTIGGGPAAGICGSGVIDLMATLLDAGFVSQSGAFTDAALAIAEDTEPAPVLKQLVIAEADAPAGGARVVFTQKDVREFQLAKGAIRAGIDILIEEMGEAPAMFYLAGGFGQNISLESAFRVGLIPREMRGRIRFVGNTSLGGCVDACVGGGSDTPLPSLRAAGAAREINLGAHKSFNGKFMETMMFGE
ncbi:MAG: ASKHA domain-containing protein [Clostridiales Family XIII bacterium]|jgi:uncharacterized 2Fe-2S/4Fe-4S cluster protein (DUF4445 family)|nr:ASKHA domain-containing protein [Clostridiales Family XIII bacterium]